MTTDTQKAPKLLTHQIEFPLALRQFPPEVATEITTEIALNGTTAVPNFEFIQDLINNLRENSEISAVPYFKAVIYIINFFSTEDPSKLHYQAAREVLKKAGGEKLEADDTSRDWLAREIVKECREFASKLIPIELLQENVKNLHIGFSYRENDKTPHLTLSVNERLWLDDCFLNHISRIGKRGKEVAKKLSKSSNKWYQEYQEDKDNLKLFRLWIDPDQFPYCCRYLKFLATILWEDRKPAKQKKYRQSGHLVDEKLKYSKPTSQPSLFDALSLETKQKIEESKIEVKAEGIKLTLPESKLIHALCRILHDKSQNRDSTKSDFYCGNLPSEIVPYGGKDLQAKETFLRFTPAELYKAYIGHDEYSGHDINFVNSVVCKVESRKLLMKYDRVKKVLLQDGKTQTLTDRIEEFAPLIRIISFVPDLTDEEKAQLDNGNVSIRESKGEIIIALNPIFIDQIDTKFIEFPADTNRRLVIAAGGHKKVTESMHTLMEWCLREISANRSKSELNEENLPYMLGLERYVKQNRKSLLKERIDKDVQAIANMGIILQVEKIPNSTGGSKWVFHLNKDYE